MSEQSEPGVVQVVMMDTLFESFQHWLQYWGMEASRTQFDPDDLPTYMVGFSSNTTTK